MLSGDADTPDCPYCLLQAADRAEPLTGLVARDQHYLVRHGEPESSAAGALQIISHRHFVDFADMTEAEAAAFGTLVAKLDRAVRATTDAERVHLVSTRDRVPHFHAWLYPRAASNPLRGTTFLAAPQSSSPAEAEAAAAAIRDTLAAG